VRVPDVVHDVIHRVVSFPEINGLLTEGEGRKGERRTGNGERGTGKEEGRRRKGEGRKSNISLTEYLYCNIPTD
jgi:hypothetical protein